MLEVKFYETLNNKMKIPKSLEPTNADWILYEYFDSPFKIILDLF